MDDPASFDLLRRRVINVVGHELRTPITTLRGLTELLGTTTDDPERTEALHEAMKRAARRAESLVDDLLVASGIATALPVGEPEVVDVLVATADAWAAIDDVAADTDLAIDVPEGLTVRARAASLHRALTAVLDNAVRHGAEPVELAASSDGTEVVLVVTDGGPGIPEAELPVVAEAFFRGERAVMRGPGLGLGLSLASELVRHEGGTLTIAAPDGGGTAVTIRLPGGGP